MAPRPRKVFLGFYELKEVDEREYPWRMICFLQVRRPDAQFELGTGVLIGDANGPRAIVTAAHVLLTDAGAGQSLSVMVGDARPFPVPPELWTVNPAYVQGAVGSPEDYAVIRLPDGDLGIGDLGQMAIFPNIDDPTAVGPVFVSGYPNSLNSDLDHPQQFSAGGPPIASQGPEIDRFTDQFIYHRLDTGQGHSGAPLFFAFAPEKYATMGIHIGFDNSVNQAVRITTQVAANIVQWSGMA
jgi:V8-like Glu-specific endopeptidase